MEAEVRKASRSIGVGGLVDPCGGKALQGQESAFTVVYSNCKWGSILLKLKVIFLNDWLQAVLHYTNHTVTNLSNPGKSTYDLFSCKFSCVNKGQLSVSLSVFVSRERSGKVSLQISPPFCSIRRWASHGGTENLKAIRRACSLRW